MAKRLSDQTDTDTSKITIVAQLEHSLQNEHTQIQHKNRQIFDCYSFVHLDLERRAEHRTVVIGVQSAVWRGQGDEES